MRVRELILKQKKIVVAGTWATGKPMPATAFPLSKSRQLRLGRQWTWRVDRVAIGDSECRLLTAFQPQKHTFIGWLALVRGEAAAVLARLEYHGDEPGWHCHAMCGDVHDAPVGVVKPYGVQRLPKARAFHRRRAFEITEDVALSKSFGFFRVTGSPEGTLV